MKTLKHLIGGIQQSILTINLKRGGGGAAVGHIFLSPNKGTDHYKKRVGGRGWGIFELYEFFFPLIFLSHEDFFRANGAIYTFSAPRRA